MPGTNLQAVEMPPDLGVVVLIPCYNEEATIRQVVHGFRQEVPDFRIYVFDNNSTDRTAELARSAGAIVVHSPRQGKGYVVQHMFQCVEADCYLMVDGDGTYPPADAARLVEMLRSTACDMLVGTRLAAYENASFRRFHYFGNHTISRVISAVFHIRVTDALSGYRCFSRDFVKTLPLVSSGFEIEMELTLQAAAKKFVICETPIRYGERPTGSLSKLNTVQDGWRIMRTIGFILKNYKPLTFFGSSAILAAVLSVAAGVFPILDYLRTGSVPHLPLAVLAASLAVIATIAMSIGIVLHTIAVYQAENYQLWRMDYKAKHLAR